MEEKMIISPKKNFFLFLVFSLFALKSFTIYNNNYKKDQFDISLNVLSGYENTRVKMDMQDVSNYLLTFQDNAQYYSNFDKEYSFLSSKVKSFRTDLHLKVKAQEGSLKYGFLEVFGGIGWHLNERKNREAYYTNDGPAYNYQSKFSSDSKKISGHANNYDLSIAAGYNIVKLWETKSPFAIKPLIGYSGYTYKMSRQILMGHVKIPFDLATKGFDVNHTPQSINYIYPKARIQNFSKMHGGFFGVQTDAHLDSHHFWLRGQYHHFHTARSDAKIEVFHLTQTKRFKAKRGKRSCGYKASGGYDYKINTHWELCLSAQWHKFVSKKPGNKEKVLFAYDPGQISKTVIQNYKFLGGLRFTL